MTDHQDDDAVTPRGVVAIIRSTSQLHVASCVETLVDAGVASIELTTTIPDAEALLESLRRDAPPSVSIGMGSVTTVAQSMAAIAAGANYLVGPVFDKRVHDQARAHKVPYVPGCLTPSELVHASRSGCALLKLFPAGTLGPAYLRDILAPVPPLRVVATGGISIAEAPAYIHAGAVAVGLGGPLMGDALNGGSQHALKARAAQLLRLVREAQGV